MTHKKKFTALSKPWREFVKSFISFLEDMSDENEKRFILSLNDYHVGEKESQQEDWIWETKELIVRIKGGDRASLRKMYNFIKERYKGHDYHKKILEIAEKKGIGEYVWKI